VKVLVLRKGDVEAADRGGHGDVARGQVRKARRSVLEEGSDRDSGSGEDAKVAEVLL
jgi:hypothetical protein